MAITDITYSKVIQNLLPPQKRLSKMTAWLNVLVHPLQWLHDVFFDNYIGSGSYTYVDLSSPPVITTAFTNCKFINSNVYQTQINNVDVSAFNPLLGQLTDGDTIVWVKIVDDACGFIERMSFNCQVAMMNYFLNRYFNPKNYVDKLFISLNDMSEGSFYVGIDESESSTVAISDILSDFFIYSTDIPIQKFNFTINVPALVATDLGVNYEQIIRNVVDKYNLASLFYNVVIY